MHSYSASIFIRKESKKKDGTCAVYLRVFINQAKKTVPTGVSVRPEQFDDENKRVKLPKARKSEEYDMNLLISQSLSKAHNIFMDHRREDIVLTVDSFIRCYYNEGIKYDFFAYGQKAIANWKGVNAPATLKNDNDAKKRLEAFQPAVIFSELNETFAYKFNEWMIKQKLSHNTRWKYIKSINKIINAAVRDQIIFENKFRKFKIHKKETERTYLTTEELQKIINLVFSGKLSDSLLSTGEAFIFSATSGGMRISDWSKLTTDHITENVLSYIPEKTIRFKSKLIKLNLTDVAKKIIEGKSGKLFPFLGDMRAVNQDLKTIAYLCEINKVLTSHVARHTFSTQFLTNGGKVETLQQVLGHSRVTMTMVYSHLTNETVRKSMDVMNKYKIT